jgi:hypothetical protein
MLALKGYAYRANRGGSIESARLGPEWLVETKTGHLATVGIATVEESLSGEFRLSSTSVVPPGRYRFERAMVTYQAPRGAVLRPNLSLEAGSFFDGWQATARIVPTWNASRYLELGGTFQTSDVSFPQRDQHFRAHLVGLRGRVMVSTRFSAAAFVQYNSANDGIFGNLRIRYNPSEGHDLYVVYNTGLNTDRFEYSPVRPVVDNHVLMLKYARTFDVGL